jgi:hypothetical protein
MLESRVSGEVLPGKNTEHSVNYQPPCILLFACKGREKIEDGDVDRKYTVGGHESARTRALMSSSSVLWEMLV